MTVGEIAKKMGVTVRTIQFYDREGLLSPSAQSEGGRRLYTDKDMIKLHQILSWKHLGFSLSDIKNRLIPLDTPDEVAAALERQEEDLNKKIEVLSEALEEIQRLKKEVLQMQEVDFKKYADIIVNLQMKNEYYWMIKHFDDQMMDHIRKRFDKESGMAFMKAFNHMSEEIIRLKRDEIPPESQEGQMAAEKFWSMIMDFTDGDMSILPKLLEMGNFENMNQEWAEKQALVNSYIGPALDAYFKRTGNHVFEEGIK